MTSGRVVHHRKFRQYGKLAADGRTLAYEPLGTRTLVLEDTLSGREVLRIPQPDSWSGGWAWAPDAQTLVTTTSRAWPFDQHAFRFWERATGKECLAIPVAESGSEFLNHGVAFSGDGRLLASLRGDRLLQVWDVATGRELWRRHDPAEYAQVLAFTPDGKALITGHDDSTILVWKLPEDLWQRQHPKRTATALELEQCWAALAGADTHQAHKAIWNFVEAAEDAVPFLARRLKPAESRAAPSLRQALGNLDSNQFWVREAAEKQLAAWRERAEPALRAALDEKPSLEKRWRIQRVLARFPAIVTSPEGLRHVRAVRVLEYVAASGAEAAPRADATRLAAIDLLKKLAAGDPDARLTQEAKRSLERLEERSPVTPP